VSKLGPHVIRPTGDALDWARHAGVVKALDDASALRAATNATVRVFRRYFRDQDIGRHGGDVLREVLAALGDAPATHVELFNETAQRLGQGLERYVEFTREAVRFLNVTRPDLTLVAFCFSTGNPDRDDWEYLRAHEYGEAEVIGLHAYWGAGGFTPWHALRHRTAHAWTDADHPPFLLTEVGRDRVERGKGGWRADGLTEDAYLAELLAYEAELLRDPYVIAATPFTAGPTPDWHAFDTDPLSGRLVALAGPLPTPPEEVTVPILTGIDLSNNNGVVDLGLVKAAGNAFVAMKASGDEGRGNVFLDPFFPENWHQANAHELVRIAYHYARPSAVTPAQSVTTLQRAIDAVGGLKVGDNVALDIEDPEVPEGVSLHVWVAEWLALAEQVFGVAPYRYSAHYYTSTHDLEHDDLAKYPVWWASYQAIKPAPSPGWAPIRIWQNSASGRVPGVGGDVDTNLFEGTREELLALGKLGLPELVEPAAPGVPADVIGALDVLWDAAGADVVKQRAIVQVKVAFGLQEAS
jgi:lysozyme